MMLRKQATAPSGATSSSSPQATTRRHRPNHRPNHHRHRHRQDDGEKSTKLRRQSQQSQFRTVLFFLGLGLLLTTVAIVKFRHSSKKYYTPQTLRSRRGKEIVVDNNNNNNNSNEEAPPSPPRVNVHSDFVHPNSIYNDALQVLDNTNNLVSLSQFKGMVTLIVNVACH